MICDDCRILYRQIFPDGICTRCADARKANFAPIPIVETMLDFARKLSDKCDRIRAKSNKLLRSERPLYVFERICRIVQSSPNFAKIFPEFVEMMETLHAQDMHFWRD